MSNVIALWKDNSKASSTYPVHSQTEGFQGIFGSHPKMLEVFQQIRSVAAFDYPVHVFGETGVGKELVVHAIHQESEF